MQMGAASLPRILGSTRRHFLLSHWAGGSDQHVVIEARNTAKPSTLHKTAPTMKKSPAQDANRVEVEKPCSKRIKIRGCVCAHTRVKKQATWVGCQRTFQCSKVSKASGEESPFRPHMLGIRLADQFSMKSPLLPSGNGWEIDPCLQWTNP